jgi:hypothetical protein
MERKQIRRIKAGFENPVTSSQSAKQVWRPATPIYGKKTNQEDKSGI